MKYFIVPILIFAALAGYLLYVRFHRIEQPKIEVAVPTIRLKTPRYEPKSLYVDPKYECKGVCK